MPRDLFGDVTRPSISIGNRKWYTVPVSLFSHAVVIATIVIVPIVAAPYMPNVLNHDEIEYITTKLPPPPPPPERRPTELKPVDNRNAAPLTAPDTITPEPAFAPEPFEVASPGLFVGGDNLDRVLAPPPIVAPAPSPQEPLRVGGTIRQPQKVRNVDPVYPQMAILARVEGVVIIEATIGANGRLIDARVLRGHHMLDKPALDAVLQWEFTPTLLNGVPVPVIMTVTVQFKLSK